VSSEYTYFYVAAGVKYSVVTYPSVLLYDSWRLNRDFLVYVLGNIEIAMQSVTR